MKRLVVNVIAAGAALTSLSAAAQFQKPEDAIKYRQSVMTVMANHLGRVGAMAQGKAPYDAAVVAPDSLNGIPPAKAQGYSGATQASRHELSGVPGTLRDSGLATRRRTEASSSTERHLTRRSGRLDCADVVIDRAC